MSCPRNPANPPNRTQICRQEILSTLAVFVGRLLPRTCCHRVRLHTPAYITRAPDSHAEWCLSRTPSACSSILDYAETALAAVARFLGPALQTTRLYALLCSESFEPLARLTSLTVVVLSPSAR